MALKASVYTFSDLHLFCRRSVADLHMREVCEAAKHADYFVLNGDIVDIRWTTLRDERETVVDALNWLNDLTTSNPRCEFHYVLGNHDNVEIFMDALARFTENHPTLFWHPYYFRLGDTMFLHGDVVHKKMSSAGLTCYRNAWLSDHKRGEMINVCYDIASLCGVPPALHRMFFRTHTVVRRLSDYLDEIGHGPDTGVEQVYYGHTHVPVNGYEYRGMRFYNGGAAMPGVDFSILRAEVGIS